MRSPSFRVSVAAAGRLCAGKSKYDSLMTQAHARSSAAGRPDAAGSPEESHVADHHLPDIHDHRRHRRLLHRHRGRGRLAVGEAADISLALIHVTLYSLV